MAGEERLAAAVVALALGGVVLPPAVGLQVAVWAVAYDTRQAVIFVVMDFCSSFSQLDALPSDDPHDLFDVFDLRYDPSGCLDYGAYESVRLFDFSSQR